MAFGVLDRELHPNRMQTRKHRVETFDQSVDLGVGLASLLHGQYKR